MGKIIWEDYPSPKNLFTKRNATMKDLETNKTIQYYSANTKIVIVQKAQVNDQTFLRTASARDHDLDWAFEASAFGLPNDVAPSAPINFSPTNNSRLEELAHSLEKRQKSVQKNAASSKDGEKKLRLGWLRKLFGRKNG